jgi:predicted nucleic acid-binding protein
MRTLLDTNILLRSSQPNSAHHGAAVASVSALMAAGRTLCISSQTIYEFLAVATKPVKENGLGMSHEDADAQLAKLLRGIDVIYDSELVADELRRLVVAHRVTGKKVHDVRLVAVMTVNNVPELLTFNIDDFKRFAGITAFPPSVPASGIT